VKLIQIKNTRKRPQNVVQLKSNNKQKWEKHFAYRANSGFFCNQMYTGCLVEEELMLRGGTKYPVPTVLKCHFKINKCIFKKNNSFSYPLVCLCYFYNTRVGLLQVL